MTSELEIKLTDLSSQERKLKRELKQLENDKYKLIQTIHLQNDQQKEKEKSAQTLKDIENIQNLEINSALTLYNGDDNPTKNSNDEQDDLLCFWLWNMIDEYFQSAPKLNIISCPPTCDLFEDAHTHYSCSLLDGNYIYTVHTEQYPDLFCNTPKYQQLHRKVDDRSYFSMVRLPPRNPYLYEIFTGGCYRVMAQRLFNGESVWYILTIKKLK